MTTRGSLRVLPVRGWVRAGLWGSVPGGLCVVASIVLVVIGEPTRLFKVMLMLIAILIAVAAIRRPQAALYTIVVLAAVDRSINFEGTKFQISVAALILFAPAFLRAWRPQVVPMAVRVGLVLIVLGSVLATITARDPAAAAVETLRWVLLVNVVMGGLGIISRLPGVLRGLACWLVTMGIVVGGFGFLQQRGIYVFVAAPYDQIANSTFGYYSNFANFEALVFVVAVGLALHASRERSLRVFLLGVTGVFMSVFSLLITQSRGAVVLLVVGVAILLITRIKRTGALLVTVGSLVVIAGTTYVLVPAAALAPYLRRFETVQGGDTVRFQLQNGGWALLQEEPLGIGFNNFQQYVANGQVAAGDTLAHSHNLFIQTGLDIGWIGFVGFMVVVALAVFGSVARGIVAAGHGLPVIFGAALAGFLVQGWDDYFFFESGSMIAFVVLILGALADVPRVRAHAPAADLQTVAPAELHSVSGNGTMIKSLESRS